MCTPCVNGRSQHTTINNPFQRQKLGHTVHAHVLLYWGEQDGGH